MTRRGWNLVSLWSTKFMLRALLAAATALFAGGELLAQAPKLVPKPFESMAGTWTGTGTVTLGKGEKERIRCRVSYAVSQDANRVEQELRCASDSYKFELSADITYVGGFINGRWSERTQRTSGTISGRATTGLIEALAESSGFAAFFTMTTRGDQQTVKIESKSSEVSDVTITLRKTGS
jgi:hypothetical protein